MRIASIIGSAAAALILCSTAVAGSNELFEIKTATHSLNKSAKRVLSNGSRAERWTKRFADKADLRMTGAYTRCPSRARQARWALYLGALALNRFDWSLARVMTPDDLGAEQTLLDLEAFGAATFERALRLLWSRQICDQGETLIQDELDYENPPGADFVEFATGWGNRGFGAHGTFGRFAQGRAAPDHIHSHTYYGVVISGNVRNPFGDTPGSDLTVAKRLPPGSFWSVPARAVHTTACDAGEDCLFYFHSRDRFDFDTNVNEGEETDEAQEIALNEILDALEPVSPFASMYTLWGNREEGAHGTFGEFIGGQDDDGQYLGVSPSHTHSFSYHGVVLSGTMANPFGNEPMEDAVRLEPGDYWFVPAGVEHVTACLSETPCTFYFHSEGAFDFLPSAPSD